VTATAALLLPDAVCLLCCLVAAVTDLRSRTIPNWLTLPALGLGLLLNPALHAAAGAPWQTGLLSAAGGCLLLGISFGVLGLVNFVGMGDVKLMAAVGALVRWPLALGALAFVAIAGGVVALGYALARGRLGHVLRNIALIGRGLVKRSQPDAPMVRPELHRIPYAIAILLGAAWAVASRYLPALRP
jgi:prepilin peptidase CpaA